MHKNLNIAVGQLNLICGDVVGNTSRMIETAQSARQQYDARLIVFPELAMTAYPPEDLLFHQHLHDQIEAQLERLRKASTNIAIIVGGPGQRDGKLYNMAFYFDQGQLRQSYAKIELPNYSVFDEKRYFTPGKHPCIIELEDMHIGIAICEDLWSPKVREEIQQSDMDLLVHINASPFYIGKDQHRLEMLQTCMTQLRKPILYVNQVGGQDELVFDGASCLMNAQCELVFSGAQFEEGIYPCTIALNDAAHTEASVPVSIAVSPTATAPEQWAWEHLIWKALCLGLRDYVCKNHFKGVILGLSGGIDSALTLMLAVDALGADNIRAVMMPSRYTAQMSVEDSQQMTANLNVELLALPIDTTFDLILQQLQPVFGNTPVDVTEENIQARIRSVFLMALSNKFNWAVLTTSNKSETALGYGTLYGDMAGAFAPIKDVSKTQVYRLARYCNRDTVRIPLRVLERPPSAELAPNQCDQDTLPPYEQIDPILEYFMQHRLQAHQQQMFESEVFAEITQKILGCEHKRRQAPLGIKISKHAFGKDWRYPISSAYREAQ